MAHYTEKKCCDDCIFLEKENVFHSNGQGYSNCYCTYDKTAKLIDCSVKINQSVQTPNFCPFSEKEIKKDDSIFDRISPSLGWDEIEKDGIYHIPPYSNEQRKDIVVVYKCDEYFTYRLNNDKYYGDYKICYKTSIMSKMITKKMDY